jgi:hypothetical protein
MALRPMPGPPRAALGEKVSFITVTDRAPRGDLLRASAIVVSPDLW